MINELSGSSILTEMIVTGIVRSVIKKKQLSIIRKPYPYLTIRKQNQNLQSYKLRNDPFFFPFLERIIPLIQNSLPLNKLLLF